MNIRHEMLIANAGSGKTFRLTVRTITLLALGVEPGKIAALTFTRKAAGEFMTAVFQRVAKAAHDSGELLALQRDTNIASLDTATCQKILQTLTNQMHRLCMGTIDSLFGRIARSFPLETGLAGDFSVLSETSRNAAMRETLATLFREQGADEAQFQDFLDLVRQQSRKQSEREVFSTLLTSINELHEKFLTTSQKTIWGEKEIIWPQGNPILRAGDLSTAADHLWHTIISTHPALDQKAIDAWQNLLQMAREHPPANIWGKELKAFIERKVSIDKDTNAHYFPTGGAKAARVYLHADVEIAWKHFLEAMLKPRLEGLLRRSRALHGLLGAFESTYHRLVRHQGLLTFSDITAVLAQQVDSPQWRASVGYRLDSQFDHWLLDEFQDTSRLQWRVLQGLVDDVIQDADGSRSFFYVGDTKQAIYAWRGGDPRLFFEIGNYYNQAGSNRILRADPLNVSYRSDRQIIEAINQVFGHLSDQADLLKLPRQTVTDWTQAWVQHEVAPENTNTGYFRWQTVEKDEDEEDEDGNAIDRAIANILLETRPWERGWSCAALKRSNKSVEILAAHLQSRGIPVAVEGKANPCTDNPLGIALLAAFKFAASPTDSLSHRLLECSPYANVLLGPNEFSFREKTLALISAEGFSGTIETWLGAIDLTLEPFLNSRARDFLTATTQFDAGRQLGDDIGSFIHHIENYQRQESEGAGVVRIMTIHQAKGLTLDMTIVSGLDKPFSEDKTTGILALDKNQFGKDWGLLMPGSDLAKADEVLRIAKLNLLATSTYGELCAAYVAMTRPRHGLYVLTKKIKESSDSKNLARLLALTLGYTEDSYETGNRAWYLEKPISKLTGNIVISETTQLPRPLYGTPHSFGPSSLTTEASSYATFSSDATRIGSEIHSVLASIEWLEHDSPDLASISVIAQAKLERFLSSEEAATLFTKPTKSHKLWRERAFECLLDGQWVAGIFDRILIFLNDSGTPVSAELIEFKTEKAELDKLQKRHANQLIIYRRAAALLLGLEASQISAHVVSVS